MAEKRDDIQTEPTRKNEGGLSRRDFVRTGAAAGLGAGALLEPDRAHAQESETGAADIVWDHEVDVVIAGGGCAGLTAAIRARDLGASVLVVDSNFDLGGRMLHSGSFLSLGGGDPVQRRDMKAEGDVEGFVTVAPVEDPEELDDSVDLLFTDLTDWSVVDRKAQSPYRYNEPELARSWAENCPATRQFLMDNYVRFARVSGTHGGGGLSRARGARCFLMLGDKTDIKAGTITAEDAGVADHERTSAFAPVQMNDASRSVGPNAVSNGVALSRPLDFSAREKGAGIVGGIGSLTAPAPPPPPAEPIRVGGNISPPAKVTDVPPRYPPVAQAARVQGVVILEAVIGPSGRVTDVKVLRSVPLLDDAAIEAVRQWVYTPTLLNGVPVPVIMTVTVNFTMQ